MSRSAAATVKSNEGFSVPDAGHRKNGSVLESLDEAIQYYQVQLDRLRVDFRSAQKPDGANAVVADRQ
jgi:hypothetical protein